MFESIIRDIKYSIRGLRRYPAFTAISITTLSLGIGAATAVFSVVNGVLLEPLPYHDPDRLVGVWLKAPGWGVEWLDQTPGSYFTFRDESQVFQDVGLWRERRVIITGRMDAEEVQALMVSDGFLPILGVSPAVGRTFTAADDSPAGAPVAVLGYGYWQRMFAGDRTVIGRTITVDDQAREIIGVLPPEFRFGRWIPDLLFPAQFDRSRARVGDFSYKTVARLRPGVTIEQATADVSRMIPIAIQQYGGMSQASADRIQLGANIRTLRSEIVGQAEMVLWILLGTATMVLMIAYANVANLMLVRTEGRQREFALRATIGANLRRIIQAAVLENTVLGLLGGAAGLAFAYGGVRLLAWINPQNLPRLHTVSIDLTVVVFALGIAVVSGAILGLCSALRHDGVDLATSLKEGGRTHGAAVKSHRARNALVVSQLALALILLVGSGLMIRSLVSLRQVEPGFGHPEGVLTMRIMAPGSGWSGGEAGAQMHEEIARRIEQLPGVISVGLSSSLTMDGWDSNNGTQVEEFPVREGEGTPVRRLKWIGGEYFETMENPILVGRSIDWTDIHTRAPVVVVTEDFAREYWEEPADALGKRIRSAGAIWREIVGVVGNVHDDGVASPSVPVVFMPMVVEDFWGFSVLAWRRMAFAIRTTAIAPTSLVPQIRELVRSVNQNAAVAGVGTMADILAASTAQTSFTVVTLGIAASVALALGIIGVYGVISYTVSLRTREMGIRIALGARAVNIKHMVVLQGAKLTVVGLGVGLAAALGLTRLMEALLFGVTASDWLTYGVAGAALGSVALLASYLPAHKAGNVDPMEAMRVE